jgi:hypothetical protein
MSEKANKKAKIRQATGLRQVAGVMFQAENGNWVANRGPIKLTLDHYGYKCTCQDTRNTYFRGFHTVTAAKLFARHRRHGRTIIEHIRAEKLKAEKERLGFTLSALAEKIGKSVQSTKSYLDRHRVIS